MKRGMKARMLALAASAAAATLSGAVLAQDEEEAEEAAPAVNSAACGMSFAQSGAASNVAYAALQLTACDALLAEAASAAELVAAQETITTAHEGVLGRWQAVAEELIAVASTPVPVAPPAPVAPVDGEDAEADEAAAAVDETEDADAAPVVTPNDPWSMKLAERHAIETAMDGLRLEMRLAYRLSETYADPSALAAGLEGPAAARVGDVLAGRVVCASAGITPRGNNPGTAPSWYAFAEVDAQIDEETGAPIGEPIAYEREISDGLAEAAEKFLTTELPGAPSLGVTELTSFSAKAECSRSRDWPSERPAT